MRRTIEEILYPAMEDYELDIVIGQGPGRAIGAVPLQRSRSSARRRARASSPRRCAAASASSTASTSTPRQICSKSSADRRASSTCHRSTSGEGDRAPRAAAHRASPTGSSRVRTTRRCAGRPGLDATSPEALAMLEVDEHGLDEVDRRLLRAIIEKFGGGPVGLDTLARPSAKSETRSRTSTSRSSCSPAFSPHSPGRVATPRALSISVLLTWGGREAVGMMSSEAFIRRWYPAARCGRAEIAALGAYVPPRLLTNADLEKMVDTNDEWIAADGHSRASHRGPGVATPISRRKRR